MKNVNPQQPNPDEHVVPATGVTPAHMESNTYPQTANSGVNPNINNQPVATYPENTPYPQTANAPLGHHLGAHDPLDPSMPVYGTDTVPLNPQPNDAVSKSRPEATHVKQPQKPGVTPSPDIGPYRD